MGLKNMMRSLAAASLVPAFMAVTSIGTSVQAGTDFGEDADVRAIVDDFIGYVADNGVDAATAILRDTSSKYGSAKPGLMIWINGTMGAHNKYPDLAGVNFADLQDLRGQYVIKDFTSNADAGGDYSLNYWPHYTSEEEYEYHCFSKWVKKGEIMVSSCR